MEDETPNKNPHTGAWAVLLVVPVVYLLSIGPFGYLAGKKYLPPSFEKPARTFYLPVIWLHDHTSLRVPLERYVEWWDRLGRNP